MRMPITVVRGTIGHTWTAEWRAPIARIAVMIIASGLAMGCSSTARVHVSTLQAPGATFAEQRTFRFLPVPASRAAQPEATDVDNPMLENSISGRQVRHDIAQHLTARGYVHQRDTADLAIAYYIGSHNTLVVTNYDYGYPSVDWKSGASWNEEPQRISRGVYRQGTVIVDVLDGAGKHILWRGVGRSAVSADPNTYAVALGHAVDEIMKRFPGRVAHAAVAVGD